MNQTATNQSQSISIPVNLNGMLNVTLPAHVNADEFCARALEQFKRMIELETGMGESGEATFSFDGDVWSTEGQAQVGDLMFEVQHDLAMNVSGALVALKPRQGEFGADRYRSRICAYVSEHDVYVTGRCSQTDAERVLVSIRMDGSDPTVHVMNPSFHEDMDLEGQVPLVSVPFRGMSIALN
ncbi:hypothetical protein H8F21_15265 [Pseudomonas sp. P66]|uniref:Uncharacterized protein n=1 Tax=Pseudomonas arcuscaelestis TaxID=2710591 RepID=A0ABS2BZ73_9PSED|nr:hypothetical protein [Pseudomonas arcuscaelestis]MBM5458925.1 hypothetical protein [Pseudomonas arcuscaelestis]